MKFNKLIAYPIWPDAIQVQWEIDNDQLTGVYTFEVELFIDSKTTLYKSSVILNKYYYRIPYTPLLYIEIRNALKICVSCTPPYTNARRGIEPFEQIITLYHGLDKHEMNKALDITRRETMLFERKIGMLSEIYKRKTFGEVCDKCVDQFTHTCTNSHCTACYGTGYVGGYYEPEELWADIVEVPVDKQASDGGTTEEKTAKIRLSNQVLLNKRDLVLDKINSNMWEVSAEPNLIKYRSFPVSQECSAFMLAPKDIGYGLIK